MRENGEKPPTRGYDKQHADDERERDDPATRADAFFASRRDEKGDILEGLFAKAVVERRRQQLEQLDRHKQNGAGGEPGETPGPPGSVNWTPIGPSVIATGTGANRGVSGRVNALAVGPSGSRVYAGAANGGAWFSPDGGANWRPLDDYAVSSTVFGGSTEADSLSTGAVAVRFGASAATDDVYVGTGEPFLNYDAYLGVGIRHSASGGAPGTWTLEATNLANRGIFGIVIDPDDPTVVLAATTSGLFRRPAAAPFTGWTQVTSPAFTAPTTRATSIVVAGTGASRMYYAAFQTGGVYRSPDATTWTALTGLGGAGRIALAVAESDPTIVYAFRADGTLARLVGTAFQAVAGLPASAVFPGGQGWYNIAILVTPTDPNTIFVAGDWYAVFKGTITGGPGSFTFPFDPANVATPTADATWVGQGVHSDVHALAFGRNAANTASDGSIVWVGSDGGAFRSTTGGVASSFRSRNTGLAITQTAYIAQRPDTDAVVFAGSQDNGTNRLLGEEAALEVQGGDGGGTAVDQNDPYRVMRQYVGTSLSRSTTGGGGVWSSVPFPPAAPASGEFANFVAPIASSPVGVSPGLVAFGTNRLWLSDDWGTTWVTLPTGTNPLAVMPPDLAQDVIGGGGVLAIAFASGTRVFAATSSTIWRYDKAATWSRTILPTTGLPGFHPFTSLAVADAAAGTLYAALGSGGIAHLYYWDGTTWTIAMPVTVVDVPAHAVVVDPDHPNDVYVGTDVGVWKGTKTGPTTWTWALFSPGLPESAVVDLALQRQARLLRASTHGRGVWEIELDAAAGLDPDLYLRVNYADTGRTPGGARHPWVEGAPDPTRQGFNVYHWMSADVKVRRPSLVGLPALSAPPDYLDYVVNIGDYVDSTSNTETADITGTNRIFVEVHNRGLTPVPAAQVRVCLLITDAAAGLPPLPASWATHINAGDTSTAWLSGSNWHFADPVTPYRTPPADVDVRTPQVVEFPTDFASLSLPLGHEHVCAAAFVTATGDSISSVDTSLDNVTMHDKHVAHRNLHLVAAGAKPSTEGGEGYDQEPQTFLIEFHNPGHKRAKFELVFDKTGFPGALAVALPPAVLDQTAQGLDGFELVDHAGGWAGFRARLGEWIEELGELVEELGERIEQLGEAIEEDELEVEDERPDRRSAPHRAAKRIAQLDRERTLVADKAETATLKGVEIEPGAPITAAITVEAPSTAAPGDSFRFDVLQRSNGAILGGSTYVIAVTKADARD
jgi:hypothetical protein